MRCACLTDDLAHHVRCLVGGQDAGEKDFVEFCHARGGRGGRSVGGPIASRNVKRHSLRPYSRRVKFEDLPLPATPPRCAHPCDECGLRRNPAFLPLPPDELRSLEQFREGSRVVDPGRLLVQEHHPSKQLFTLYSGWAFRFKTLSDGRRQILHFLLPGDFIGLQDEFADGQTYGVEAVTGISLCVFPRDRLWNLFHAQPRLGYDITWLAAREEKMVDDNLVTAGRRNASERVAMLLMHLYRRAERVGMVRDG
ncbi:MAG: Crp/Fnr family transcriptional regulator, partial [Variovorax sp.]